MGDGKNKRTKKLEKGRGLDPTTLSVVWNKFESILDEIEKR
jgi:hypothetical protein